MKIVIGGQMGKQEIKNAVDKINTGEITVEIRDDISAAMAVKSGQADYYLGACMTGGGGALAMAIAILGYGKCKAITSGDASAIQDAVKNGIVAFGFTPGMTETVVPVILEAIKENRQ